MKHCFEKLSTWEFGFEKIYRIWSQMYSDKEELRSSAILRGTRSCPCAEVTLDPTSSIHTSHSLQLLMEMSDG